MIRYDLLVIGSGPAGQRAAVQAAKLGKRVAIIEKRQVVGGVCVNTGTIPSKSLREAVLYLTGFGQRSIYGSSFNSIVGYPASQLTTDYWFTSYDDMGMTTDLVIAAP